MSEKTPQQTQPSPPGWQPLAPVQQAKALAAPNGTKKDDGDFMHNMRTHGEHPIREGAARRTRVNEYFKPFR